MKNLNLDFCCYDNLDSPYLFLNAIKDRSFSM